MPLYTLRYCTQPLIPIVHFDYSPLIVLASVFPTAWYKIVTKGQCAHRENTSDCRGLIRAQAKNIFIMTTAFLPCSPIPGYLCLAVCGLVRTFAWRL